MTFALATRPSPFPGTYWVVEGRLLAGPFPGHSEPWVLEQRISALRDLGIERFVNLMEPDERDHDGRAFSTYAGYAEKLGAQCEHYPIRDRGVPSPATMVSVLNALDRALDDGRSVYLHCWGGIGRTGTAVACWLLRHRLAEVDTVFSTLDALRSRDPERGHRPSPETAAQRSFVLDWAGLDGTGLDWAGDPSTPSR